MYNIRQMNQKESPRRAKQTAVKQVKLKRSRRLFARTNSANQSSRSPFG